MKSPEMGMGDPEEKSPEVKENILGGNLGALCDIFISNNRIGDYSSMQERANEILSIVTEHFDEQNRNIRQPYEFLRKLRAAEEIALSNAKDNSEQVEIKGLFKHVDMPGLELPKDNKE